MATRRMLNSNRRTRLNSALSDNVREELLNSGNYSEEDVEQILIAAEELGYSDEETINHEWVVFPARNDGEFAETYLELSGSFIDLPDHYSWLLDYFDYDSYGYNLRVGSYTNNNENGYYVMDLTWS